MSNSLSKSHVWTNILMCSGIPRMSFCENDGQIEGLFGDVCDLGVDNDDSDGNFVESNQKYS